MTRSAHKLDRNFQGNLPIVPTPFDTDGALAIGDIAKMVDYYERCGVEGLTILGVMGEAHKLSAAETSTLVKEFLRCAAGRLAIVVGVSSPSLARSVELGSFSVGEGAAGVMLLPMQGLKTDDTVAEFFERFAEDTAGRVPICVQDDPPVSNVNLTLPAWCRISRIPSVIMLKHEPVPGLQKLTRILDAQRKHDAERVSVLTSSNAMYLPQELVRGCDGAMVGVAYQDAIVRICKLFWEGNVSAAFDLHDALLPLIRHEKQGPFGLAIRKEIMRRRGAMSTNAVRYPGAKLDSQDIAELEVIIDRFEARIAELLIALPARLAA